MSSRPFDSFPTGTEPYDGLGNRLKIDLESVADNIDPDDPELRITYRVLFDGNPIAALDYWPSEDDCEDVEFYLIPKQSAISETGYSGPQPQDHYNVSRVGNTRDITTFEETFSAKHLKPGRYRYSIVAVAHLNLPTGSTIAARRVDFEIRVTAAVGDETIFWAIEHVGASFARINRQRYHLFKDGEHKGSVDGPNCQSLLRAPNNLLINSRYFATDPTTGDAYIFHYSSATSPAQIRQITADKNFITLPAIADLNLGQPQCLAVDGANKRLWVASGHDLHVISLDEMKIIATRSGFPVSAMDIDRTSGELWVAASRQGQSGRGVLHRVDATGKTTLTVASIQVDGSGQVKSIQALNDGRVLVRGVHNRKQSYVRLSNDGSVQAQSPQFNYQIIQFGANLETSEVWELILNQSRVPVVRRLSSEFQEISQHGRVELGFQNMFGCDYVPSLNGAVIFGSRKFNRPPFFRGQLAVLKDDGSSGSIDFSANVMGVIHSAI